MDLGTLSHLLASTLVVDKSGTRQQAEQQLKAIVVANTPGFVVSLLQLIQQSTDPSLQQSAALYLKNTIASQWDSSNAEHPISEADKALIRENIFPVMGVAPRARRILSAAVSEICNTDFPHVWTNIVSLFVTGMTQAADIDALDNSLSIAHSVLSRYRILEDDTKVDDVSKEVTSLAKQLTVPLLGVMNTLLSQVSQATGQVAESACVALGTAFEVLYDLTFQFGISDQYADNFAAFNHVFVTVLGLQREDLLASEYSEGALTNLKSVAVNLLASLTRTSNEDFAGHIPQYMQIIWGILTSPSSAFGPSDELIINCLEFIISVINSPQMSFFDNPAVFQSCCELIIFPNLNLFESDIDLMKDEPDAYISREVEGSNSFTRRRAACNIIRALMKAFPHHNQVFVTYVQALAADNSDWKKKSSLITLVTAVSLSGNTAGTQRGATTLTQVLPFMDFFTGIIVPLLTPSNPMPEANSNEAILTADAIRFVTTFRIFLLKDWQPICERLGSWLSSPDHITSSLAAHALERWIAIRANTVERAPQSPTDKSEYALTSEMVAPVVGPILFALCSRVAKEKKPNTYMMLCLMRFCLCVPQATTEFVPPIAQHISMALAEACKNPTNPIYNHAMFEVISSIIAAAPQHAAAIETTIWQSLFEILSKDIVEFVPYSLQIMGQLLDAREASERLPEHYQVLIAPLLSAQMYEQPGTIPAAVRMLTAVIRRDAAFLEQNGLIEQVLQVFNKLLFLKKHDHDGMNVMIALVMALPFANLQGYINQVYIALFRRLQTSTTPKYIRCLILFFSVLIIHHGVERVVTAVNTIQNGLFWMYLNNVWLKNMQKVTGDIPRTCCVVALATLVCESTTLQAEQPTWISCVTECLKMIHTEAEKDDHKSFVPQFLQLGDLKDSVGDGGFVNAFCPLTCATAKPVNPCPHVTDANGYFKQRMMMLAQGTPQLDALLGQQLQPNLYALIK